MSTPARTQIPKRSLAVSRAAFCVLLTGSLHVTVGSYFTWARRRSASSGSGGETMTEIIGPARLAMALGTFWKVSRSWRAIWGVGVGEDGHRRFAALAGESGDFGFGAQMEGGDGWGNRVRKMVE